MPSAVELSAYVALFAVGLLGANLLLGLLMAAGYNPARHWPNRAVKLFRLHNWTGYIALSAAIVHPAILLFSSSPRFHVIDLLLPFWSPVQPFSNVLGAIALYIVIVVVATLVFSPSARTASLAHHSLLDLRGRDHLLHSRSDRGSDGDRPRHRLHRWREGLRGDLRCNVPPPGNLAYTAQARESTPGTRARLSVSGTTHTAAEGFAERRSMASVPIQIAPAIVTASSQNTPRGHA